MVLRAEQEVHRGQRETSCGRKSERSGCGSWCRRPPEPRGDGDGRQKVDRASGESLYATELVAIDDTGAEVVKVTTAGAPKVAPDQMVQVSGLVALPWSMEGRSGVAFRAASTLPVKAGA